MGRVVEGGYVCTPWEEIKLLCGKFSQRKTVVENFKVCATTACQSPTEPILGQYWTPLVADMAFLRLWRRRLQMPQPTHILTYFIGVLKKISIFVSAIDEFTEEAICFMVVRPTGCLFVWCRSDKTRYNVCPCARLYVSLCFNVFISGLREHISTKLVTITRNRSSWDWRHFQQGRINLSRQSVLQNSYKLLKKLPLKIHHGICFGFSPPHLVNYP